MPTAPLPAVRGVTSGAGPVLLAALGVGLLRQGGYFPTVQWSLVLFVTGALLLASTEHVLGTVDVRTGPAPFLLTLAGWAVVLGAGDAWTEGVRAAALLVGIVAVLAVTRRLSDAERSILLAGLVAVAALVALSGWAGVVYRVGAWSVETQGLARASTTVTYPNAAAAVLVLPALPAVAVLAARPRFWPASLAATMLLAGIGATLSRAGVVALLTGLAVLAVLRGPRSVGSALRAPLLGAAVILLGLLPSTAEDAAPVPALAVLASAALLAGLALGAGLPQVGARARTLLGVAAAAVVGVGAVAGLVWGSAGDLLRDRFTASSPDRGAALRAAWHVVTGDPLTGAGPGLAELRWTGADGVSGTIRYVHNEYVQAVAELGVPGAVLVAAALAGFGWLLWSARRPGGAVWAGGCAAAVAFAVHSGFDFIWHVPVVPLMAATLIGLAAVPGGGFPHGHVPRRKESG